MNYRHAYHAGNFADVLKHITLARILEHLKRKEKAFRVIDTHAGTGLYDLSAPEAEKTGEWRAGIGRLFEARLAPAAANLVQPYLDAVRSFNPGGSAGTLTTYPGSPALIRALLRPQDRLLAIELHPADAATLKARFAGDIQVRVLELDGWLALGAHVPPKERRGLVLVDPPFEEDNEWARLADGLAKAWRRWPGGTYALWYPEKDARAVARFRATLRDLGIPKMLDLSLRTRPPSPEPRLDGSGLVVVNPPFTLVDEMRVLLPVLSRVLADQPGGAFHVEWLSDEAAAKRGG